MAGEEQADALVTALLADAADQLDLFGVEEVPTVYIGGGTPSVLGTKRLERLLGGLQKTLPNPPEEFTLEANPESADGEFLRCCQDNGVRRISLGAQSFHEPSRRAVHRAGGERLLAERLALLARHLLPPRPS